MRIYNFEEIDSTNDFAERIKGSGEDAIITARVQTDGHGSKGRSFVSDKGGLYLTKLSFYKDFPAGEVFKIMINSSVAVCRMLEKFSLSPEIKWPNDVFVDGKKICGILINNTFSGGFISSSVVGIGINIDNVFPPELEATAINMRLAGAKNYSFDRVRDELIAALGDNYDVGDYKPYLKFLSSRVYISEGDKKSLVTAEDVDSFGRLIISENGQKRAVTAAEVTLRLK